MAPNTDGQDFVTLRVPREHAKPVATMVRGHITELPQEIRNDLQSQLSKWGDTGAGASGGSQSGSNRETAR